MLTGVVFSFDAPDVTNLFQNGAITGGGSVTAAGLNFGPSDYTQSFRLGGAICDTTSWITTTTVSCIGGSQFVDAPNFGVITMSQVLGTGAALYSFDAPVASDVKGNSPRSGGASISLTGLT